MRKRTTASTLTASLGLLAALTSTIRAAALPHASDSNVDGTPITLPKAYSSATSTAKHDACVSEDRFDPTMPPPCGPLNAGTHAALMQCMIEPKLCKGAESNAEISAEHEKGLVSIACRFHPELPTCQSHPGLIDSGEHKRNVDDVKGYLVPEKMEMVPNRTPAEHEDHRLTKRIRTNSFWPKCPWGQ